MDAHVVRRGDVVEVEGRTVLSGDGILLSIQFDTGVDPSIQLSWSVDESYWSKGYKLLGFHRRDGFCAEEEPYDLNKHGNLIIEQQQNATFATQLVEGWHYFTFVLTRPLLGGCFKISRAPLRFSRNVPSLKNAIGRIDDQMKLQRLQNDAEIMPVLHQLRLLDVQDQVQRKIVQLEASLKPSAEQSKIEQVLAKMRQQAHDRVALEKGRQELITQLKRMKDFKKLRPGVGRQILNAITDVADIDEERMKP